jgi:hypothetical protein
MRSASQEVKPVVYKGIKFIVPNTPEKMGYVEAWDTATNKKVWEKKVYDVVIKPGIEVENQWVFIKELSIKNEKLIIIDEENRKYEVDIISEVPINFLFVQQEELSKEQIIQKAIKALEKEGETLNNRTLIYDEGNKLWEEKLKTINKEMTPNYEFLKDANYQAICFALNKGWLGGDIWFFIDKKTGKVLALYGEE